MAKYTQEQPSWRRGNTALTNRVGGEGCIEQRNCLPFWNKSIGLDHHVNVFLLIQSR